jgi:hypothetical protein
MVSHSSNGDTVPTWLRLQRVTGRAISVRKRIVDGQQHAEYSLFVRLVMLARELSCFHESKKA